MSKSKSVQVHFVPRENGPERLVTEAELHFEDGPLAGMRLVGFCLWKSPVAASHVSTVSPDAHEIITWSEATVAMCSEREAVREPIHLLEGVVPNGGYAHRRPRG